MRERMWVNFVGSSGYWTKPRLCCKPFAELPPLHFRAVWQDGCQLSLWEKIDEGASLLLLAFFLFFFFSFFFFLFSFLQYVYLYSEWKCVLWVKYFLVGRGRYRRQSLQWKSVWRSMRYAFRFVCLFVVVVVVWGSIRGTKLWKYFVSET